MSQRKDDHGNVVKKGAAVGHGPAPTIPPPPARPSSDPRDAVVAAARVVMENHYRTDVVCVLTESFDALAATLASLERDRA